MRPAAIIAVAAVLALSLGLNACGGDDNDTSGPTAGSRTPAATPSPTVDGGRATVPSTPAETTVTSEPAASGTATPRSGDIDDFKDSAKKFPGSVFVGEYRVLGDAASLGTGTMTLTKDGVERLRFDISTEQDGERFELIFIDSGDASHFCLKEAGDFGGLLGIDPGEGVCFESGADEVGGPGDLTSELQNIDDQAESATNATKRTVAGADADCASIVDVDGTAGEVCFGEDGALLYQKGSDGGSFEAITIRADVSDGAFTPPYPVREIPDGSAP